MQIRAKLTLQFIVLVAGILLFSLCFIYLKFRKMTENEFYDNLRSKALMTAEMVLHEEEKIKLLADPETDPEANSAALPFRENIVIYNAQLQKVFAFNRAAEPLSLAAVAVLKTSEECIHRRLRRS